MFKKSILSAATIATLAAVTAMAGSTSAFAGGYGYNGGGYGYNGGYQAQAQTQLPNHVWQQHVAWCYDRFNTYNEYNNTYQPYNGPRQQCWSPYYNG